MQDKENEQLKSHLNGESNDYIGTRPVIVHKLPKVEIVEVEKEKISNIKNAVDEAANYKQALSSEVTLGLSTTFLGTFLGCIPSIAEMIQKNKITTAIFIYSAFLFAALILFSIYVNMRRKESTTLASVISKIKRETDSIKVIEPNSAPDDDPSNALITLENK